MLNPGLILRVLNLLESVFIEIISSKRQRMVIGVIYRPPNRDINQFNDAFDLLLTEPKPRQTTKYIYEQVIII